MYLVILKYGVNWIESYLDEYNILVKFKYTRGEEDFIDAMRSLKRQIALQVGINDHDIYQRRRRVLGTILTLDEDDSNDLVLTEQGIPIIRILEAEIK